MALALATITACRGDGPAPPPAAQPASQSAEPLQPSSGPFSPALIQRVKGVLTDSGVQVYSDADVFENGLPGPLDGFAVSEFQARNMAIEIANDAGGGFLGADLDEIAPLPPGVPSISYFIAAWISLGSTPAAKAAAQLMGPRDWTDARFFVYPSVVLAAFVGDAIRFSEPGQASWNQGTFSLNQVRVMTAGFGSMALQQDAGPCGAINSFVNSVLSNLFNKIKIEGGSGVGGFFASLFNKAVDLVGVVVKGVIQTITAPIANAMRAAIGILGVVSYAGSLLKPWSLLVTPAPGLIHWAVGPQAPPGGTITAKPNGLSLPDWPPALVACAKLVNLDLPSTDADIGSPVTWVGAGPGLSMITRTYRDEKLPSDKVAEYRYVISRSETAEADTKGEVVNDPLTVEVAFQRRLITEMQEFLTNLFLAPLPGLAAPILKPILAPNISKILGKLTNMLRPNGSTRLTIRHHVLESDLACALFTMAEARSTQNRRFNKIVMLPPTGCGMGIVGGGPTLGYHYSDASCIVESNAVMFVGVTRLALGPGAFYLHAGDSHILGFPSIKLPNKCVLISATPLSAFSGKNVLELAAIMRPRS